MEDTIRDKNVNEGEVNDFNHQNGESTKDWRRSFKDESDDEDNIAEKAKRAVKKTDTTLKKAKKAHKKKVKKSKVK